LTIKFAGNESALRFLQNAERHRAAGLASGMAKPGVSQGTARYTATGFYNDRILQRQDSTTTMLYNAGKENKNEKAKDSCN